MPTSDRVPGAFGILSIMVVATIIASAPGSMWASNATILSGFCHPEGGTTEGSYGTYYFYYI